MCVTFFAFKPSPSFLLVLAFNRDEFFDRPTLPLAFWEDNPNILGGRDVSGEGTWLGVSKNGRYACLTNFRKGLPTTAYEKSRGELPVQFLEGTASPIEYLKELDTRGYAPFNILVADFNSDNPMLAYKCSEGNQESVELLPGIHGITNGEIADEWPKVKKGKKLMKEVLGGDKISDDGLPWSRIFTEVLGDQEIYDEKLLPDTGVGLELEKHLCSIKVKPFEHRVGVGRQYGTRSQTVVAISTSGFVEVRERSIPLNTHNNSQPWVEARESFTINCNQQEILR
ncbi:hypothetical protein BSKO_11403 [Bryopsis sp. KO-2023]|nr:hypothetical protein BSKO_11403 [Bryopsis sp. KO-2023]